MFTVLFTATNSDFLGTSDVEVSQSPWFAFRPLLMFWWCVERRFLTSASDCPCPPLFSSSLTLTACPFICSAGITESLVLSCSLLGLTMPLLAGFTVCFSGPLSAADFNCQLEPSGSFPRPLLADFALPTLPFRRRRSSLLLDRREVAEAAAAAPDVDAVPVEVACCRGVDSTSLRRSSAISCSWSSICYTHTTIHVQTVMSFSQLQTYKRYNGLALATSPIQN